jgi:hypothetical protein
MAQLRGDRHLARSNRANRGRERLIQASVEKEDIGSSHEELAGAVPGGGEHSEDDGIRQEPAGAADGMFESRDVRCASHEHVRWAALEGLERGYISSHHLEPHN